MNDQSAIYPNLSWAQFEMFNDNKTLSFEEMCKDLFAIEFLKNRCVPHADHNNPGVEVIPVLEPPSNADSPQRYISYQAKYFENNISNEKITASLKQAVKHYSGQLDAIYLFCNKVISENSKRYREYLKILLPAKIELILVTDTDIFFLLRKYPQVANYYFQDRKRSTINASGLMNSVAVISGVSDVEPQAQTGITSSLFQELLGEKLQTFKNHVCDLQFGKLKKELDLLSEIGAGNLGKKIYFYRIILAAYEKQDFTRYIELLPEAQKEEAYWLKSFSRNIRPVQFEEIMGFSVETQVVVLILLFSAQRWDCIIDLFNIKNKFSQEITKALEYHYGLSLFNLGDYDRAHNTLNCLYVQYHDQRFRLYDICALLNKANIEFVHDLPNQVKNIKELLGQLDDVKILVSDQINVNEPLIALLELQACYNLEVNERHYLDEAITRYNSYSDKVKSNDDVRLFMGLCFEMAGEHEKACELFSNCAWKTNETLAIRYLTTLVDLGRYKEAASALDELKDKIITPRIEAIHLLVLSRMNSADYKLKLQTIVDKYADSLDNIFLVGFYVEDSAVFDEIVMPKLSGLILDGLSRISLQTKIGLLAVLTQNKKLGLLEYVLDSIPDMQSINSLLAHDIYKCLFGISNTAFEADIHGQEVTSDLSLVERIADRFIKADIQKRDFLQIRLLCASANHMEFSALKYSKELFAYTHDPQIARNIVGRLYERNETNAKEYEPYLSVLTKLDEPNMCITAAFAKMKLGYFDEADYYAYKAIYLLDGLDDFDVYKGCFNFYTLSLPRLKEKMQKKVILANMIVTLEAQGVKRILALDSEDDFGDSNNHSLMVEHIGRTDPIYIKLIGKGKKYVLTLHGKDYEVVDFDSREVFIGKYVYQKVQEHPEEFTGTVLTISTENATEMIKQLLTIHDQKEQLKDLLDAYNFSDLGIPIDFFIHGNYEKYIDVQRYLLYTKDLAYYAGEPCYDYLASEKFIPALSTLVLLATHGWLDTLDWLNNQIIIPTSYMTFFKEQYATVIGIQENSPGSLVPLDDGKLTIVAPDKKIPEIWETLIDKCQNYPNEEVSDEERITYEVLEGYTWERVFARTHINTIQLDALIVAERENGTYFCDDLFFRRIAKLKGIRTINFATLLGGQMNLDTVMPIIMELSKTNYVYTPFKFRNSKERQQLIHNLLEGEKKRACYADFFNTAIMF